MNLQAPSAQLWSPGKATQSCGKAMPRGKLGLGVEGFRGVGAQGLRFGGLGLRVFFFKEL